jgi:hypothetical protein
MAMLGEMTASTAGMERRLVGDATGGPSAG